MKSETYNCSIWDEIVNRVMQVEHSRKDVNKSMACSLSVFARKINQSHLSIFKVNFFIDKES